MPLNPIAVVLVAAGREEFMQFVEPAITALKKFFPPHDVVETFIKLAPIQGLWVGDKLSPMEQMCIKSFLRMGHPFHLYVYGKVDGVPAGTTIKQAAWVAPEWKIKSFQNLANFSDYFRFLLLYKNGGYWVDLDVFAVWPFDFSEPYVFSTQLTAIGGVDDVNTGVIKMPAGCELARYCVEAIAATDTMKNGWPDIGPNLLIEATGRYGLQNYAHPHWDFCPLHYFEAPNNVFGPDSAMRCVGDAHAIHLWNEEARRAGIDKFGPQLGSSLFESLKRSVE
jgi:hypothetical protein